MARYIGTHRETLKNTKNRKRRKLWTTDLLRNNLNGENRFSKVNVRPSTESAMMTDRTAKKIWLRYYYYYYYYYQDIKEKKTRSSNPWQVSLKIHQIYKKIITSQNFCTRLDKINNSNQRTNYHGMNSFDLNFNLFHLIAAKHQLL